MTSGDRHRPATSLPLHRRVVGIAATLILVVAGFAAPMRTVEVRAVVDSPATFRLLPLDVGGYTAAIEGTGPGGPEVARQQVVRLEAGERLELAIAPGLGSGSRVKAGEVIAHLDSGRAERMVAEIEAERAEVAATLALVEAGGRPEAITTAREAVRVAQSRLVEAQTEVDRALRLRETGAVGEAELQTLQNLASTRRQEVALAEAGLAEARMPPRPEEITALQARLAAADSRLTEARARLDATTIKSPFDGVLELGGMETVLEVVSEGPPVLRLAVPADQDTPLAVGDAIEFRSGALGDTVLQGRITAVSPRARPILGQVITGQSFRWATAEIESGSVHPLPGSTGEARLRVRR